MGQEKQSKTFKILLAEKVIRINHAFAQVKALCQDYIVGDHCSEDIEISIKESDIEQERKLSKICIAKDSYFETLSVYRKITAALLGSGIILMHGACIAVQDRAYIFIAKSGTGKTTHILNWLKVIPGTYVINGDKPLVNTLNHQTYGTPWCGKEGMNTNAKARLEAIVILERGTSNTIEKISFAEGLNTIVEQTNRPDCKDSMFQVMECIDRLKDIPCFKLKCNMQEESAFVAYEALSNIGDRND